VTDATNKFIKKKIFVVYLAICAIIFVGYHKIIYHESLVNDKEQGTTEEMSNDVESEKVEIIMFHNETGPMCIDAIEFLEENYIAYQQHIPTDIDFHEQLEKYKANFEGVSEGVSESFGYYPIIIVTHRAFSGFDNEIETHILDELND